MKNKMTRMQWVDRQLLAILACPVTRTPLIYDQTANELISEAAGLAFPVRNGTPIMIVEEARVLEKA
jgi:uncharacterized protein YbaR (Trm112 family)